MARDVDFRILGPLEASRDGRPVALGGAKPRAVLASLVLRANEVVPTDRLVDELFAEIDRYYAAGKRVVRDASQAAEAAQWLAANEDATAMTPERLAALESAAAQLDEDASPVAGRRFTRA